MKTNYKKILIIQTAFIGDVILATSIVEKLNDFYPESKIDFLLRKGNESLFENHPIINEVLIWDKKNKKYDNLKAISRSVKNAKYDVVVNLHRFASSGLITALSGAKLKLGFNKNPLSFLYTNKISHIIGDGKHEIERNQLLITSITDNQASQPKLYPSKKDYSTIEIYKKRNYICLAPTSVWFTKQLPKEKWVKLIHKINDQWNIYLLGASSDLTQCEAIQKLSNNNTVVNLAGRLSFLESAALMQTAKMNYVNDSAPLHIASAMNAPVTAYFCSTIPSFGFRPLSDSSTIVEVQEKLKCRPCGLHGKKECPEGHFDCGFKIQV
ncbi:MAG: heptosyltransferase [Flavobacteriales bacterium CG_4_10_14_0_2_um_filter_32_8]|nr:MAG: heptosyltransferase [Flavobacteriales bacterium CG_4_10_14_0_2_um_filter_32_8]